MALVGKLLFSWPIVKSPPSRSQRMTDTMLGIKSTRYISRLPTYLSIHEYIAYVLPIFALFAYICTVCLYLRMFACVYFAYILPIFICVCLPIFALPIFAYICLYLPIFAYIRPFQFSSVDRYGTRLNVINYFYVKHSKQSKTFLFPKSLSKNIDRPFSVPIWDPELSPIVLVGRQAKNQNDTPIVTFCNTLRIGDVGELDREQVSLLGCLWSLGNDCVDRTSTNWVQSNNLRNIRSVKHRWTLRHSGVNWCCRSK
jgi:hypothetical protein